MQRRPALRLAPFLLLFLLSACAPFGVQADPELRLDGMLIWQESAAWFGGFSGVEVSPDGNQIIAITDRGHLATAQLIRTNGKLTGMQIQRDTTLKSPNNKALRDNYRDAEDLTKDAQGRFFVSFEQDHRVMQLHPDSGLTTPLRAHPDFAKLQANSGLETLAAHPDGRLFALPERSGAQGRPFPLYAFDGTTWSIHHHIPRRGPFLPVGAGFTPDGRLYLLERALTPLGFRSRIRRFTLDTPNMAEVTLWTTAPGQFDNLEAIGTWQGAGGQTHLILLSDDNFFRFQQTQVVELTLAPGPNPD